MTGGGSIVSSKLDLGSLAVELESSVHARVYVFSAAQVALLLVGTEVESVVVYESQSLIVGATTSGITRNTVP